MLKCYVIEKKIATSIYVLKGCKKECDHLHYKPLLLNSCFGDNYRKWFITKKCNTFSEHKETPKRLKIKIESVSESELMRKLTNLAALI